MPRQQKIPRSLRECTKNFYNGHIKGIEAQWDDVGTTMELCSPDINIDRNKLLVIEEILPALIVINAQAVKNLYDAATYQRMKEALLEMVKPMTKHQYGAKFTALFEIYEKEWNLQNGEMPWNNVSSYLCRRLNVAPIKIGSTLLFDPIKLTLMAELLMKIAPGCWKFIKENFELTL